MEDNENVQLKKKETSQRPDAARLCSDSVELASQSRWVDSVVTEASYSRLRRKVTETTQSRWKGTLERYYISWAAMYLNSNPPQTKHTPVPADTLYICSFSSTIDRQSSSYQAYRYLMLLLFETQFPICFHTMFYRMFCCSSVRSSVQRITS